MDAQLRLLTAEHRTGRSSRADGGPVLHGPEPLEAPVSWRIDDTTRAVGRSGLALARAALRQARRPAPVDTPLAGDSAGDHAHATPAAA
jgi:hypothetical protein